MVVKLDIVTVCNANFEKLNSFYLLRGGGVSNKRRFFLGGYKKKGNSGQWGEGGSKNLKFGWTSFMHDPLLEMCVH